MQIKELRKKLREEGLDAYVGTENARYLAETSASTAVIVTHERSILLCRRLDLDRALEESKIEDVRAFAKAKVPLRKDEEVVFGGLEKAIGKALEELDAKNIGFDRMDPEALERLRKEYGANYERNPKLIRDLRRIKTKRELKFLKKAAELAGKGMGRAMELIEPGLSEIEVAAEAEYLMRKSGSEGAPFNTIVASGENSWFPHARATDKKLKEGDLVVIDLGATFEGYKSDMSRTLAISPSRKQKRMLELARKAQETELRSIKPGVEAREVDEIGREVFRKSNFERFFIHGSGHGIGLDVHEPPNLSQDSKETLGEGMVITVEPGIYVRGMGGARFEDVVVVKEDGCEILTG